MKTKTVSSFAGVQHPQTEAIPQPLEIHPSVSPKAAGLLLSVVEVLIKTPHRYRQWWPLNSCETPCCILGHMAAFAGRSCFSPDSCDEAGLTLPQFESLFLWSRWPATFQKGLGQHSAAAPEAIGRIEHFLRTGE